jgi:Tfp pilus assembly pilus retraction ATPase PilT
MHELAMDLNAVRRNAEPGLPRFRVNGLRQRGAISFAFRLVPMGSPLSPTSTRPSS